MWEISRFEKHRMMVEIKPQAFCNMSLIILVHNIVWSRLVLLK